MVTHNRRAVLKTVGSFAVVGGLAGCAQNENGGNGGGGGDDGGGDTGQEQQQDGQEQEDGQQEDGGMDGETAQVRVAHLAPDAPNVDVYVDGEPALEDVAYRDISDYLEIQAGSHDIRVTEAGNEEAVVYEETLDVPAGNYTLAAIGEASGESQTFTVEVYEDDLSDPGENARLRVIHAAPDAPAVTITDAGTGSALAEDLAFGEAQSGEAPPGDYTLEVRPAGEDGEPIDTFDVTLQGGTIYTGFAVGYLAPEDAPADEPLALEVAEYPTEMDGMNGGMGNESEMNGQNQTA